MPPPEPSHTEAIVVRRHLRPAQSERRSQVIAVAASLADAGGYDAVAMKDVAERSGVALATLYRWFSSKDHLLAEVLLDWMREVDDAMRAVPMAGASPIARLSDLLRAVADAIGEQPGRMHAVITAVLSADPGVSDSRHDFHESLVQLLDIAIGDADLPDREVVIETLEHVLFSSLVHLSRGRETTDQVADRLIRVAHFLLR